MIIYISAVFPIYLPVLTAIQSSLLSPGTYCGEDGRAGKGTW